ncbi:MAG: membrane protein insertase YidC [Pseudomonadota bacterium]
MQNENTRNTIAFVVITVIFLFAYQTFVLGPQAQQRKAAQQAAVAEKTVDPTAVPASGAPAGGVYIKDRTQALGASVRVPIKTPTLSGSLSLTGGRIDDLFLTQYRATIDKDSPPVEMFRPQGMEHAYFAQFGWTGPNVPGGVPGPNTQWRLTGGTVLTPATPVTLTWDNQQGLRFTRVVSIDDQYLFTVKDTVANLGTTAITIAPYSRVERQGVPDVARDMISHEGAIGTFKKGDSFVTEQHKYKDWLKKPTIDKETTGGWLGITDEYWLAALIPTQTEAVKVGFRVRDQGGVKVQEANLLGGARVIQPGMQVTETQRLFAGAKRNEILKSYQDQLNLPRFIYAIDWGMLWFLTRPVFMLVEWFYGLLGNFGWAILALTVVIKLITFPLANKQGEAAAKMRLLKPKMDALNEKFADDPQKKQLETMELFKREKVNPVAGCLPALLTIPIFYSLFKMLTVTIEMRHAPFVGWLKDLSARDPSSIWNLFGLLPWDAAAIPLIGGIANLHVGVLVIAYAVTMWLTMSMNPPAADPIQRKMFQLMPFLFAFIMAPLAAGLLLYYTWSNILTALQQYIIMRRYHAENPIDTLIARFTKKPA